MVIYISGYLVYAVGLADMVHIDTSSPLEALMFGALISAVDPVATLSVSVIILSHTYIFLFELITMKQK